VYILTDLEGVAGIYHFGQTIEKGPENEKAKELLTNKCTTAINTIRNLDQII
jgi:D-aminopeptidase